MSMTSYRITQTTATGQTRRTATTDDQATRDMIAEQWSRDTWTGEDEAMLTDKVESTETR